MVIINTTGKRNEVWLDKPYGTVITDCPYTEEDLEKAYLSGYTNGYLDGLNDCHGPEPGPAYSAMPLTFEILSSGVVNYICNHESLSGKTIKYSINGGEWISITSGPGDISNPDIKSFQVNVGDIVQFKGDNETFGVKNYHVKLTCTADHNIYGNIMSVLDSTNYQTATTVGFHTFDSFFRGREGAGPDSNVIDASNLILPATTLGDSSYSEMFQDCKKLEKAPTLPALTLAIACYWGMFANCKELAYIKCLATDVSASGCLTVWLDYVAPEGIFVKNPNMDSWPTGTSGIPERWTVVDAE